MAVIIKYDEMVNPDGQGMQYQQSISVSGAATSDVRVLPPVGNHDFSFTTTGSGKIQVSFSSRKNVIAGNGVFFDADITGGATLSADTIGTFSGASAVRVVNVSGDSTLEVITKK